MDRNEKKQKNLCDENRRFQESMKRLYNRICMAVPRFNTNALAEKAKICKFKLVKGIRQH